MTDFSKRLKDLRKKKNISQEELGNSINLSKSTISLYESGKRQPDYGTLKEIAVFFDCSIDYLLGKTEIQDPPETIIDNALQDDPELMEFWLEMKKREDLQLLFKQVKPMTPEGVKKVIRVIKAMEEETQEG
ncbi:MAG: helix-turn-helix transcriptional regulator [Actinobacteria bacterium]|nr:helix-turn-helix transcriptional regulator [Actinomycetota bacterium]